MRSLFTMSFLALTALFTFGCAGHHYNIPRETLEQKVKVVGVAPLFADPASDLKHPEKDSLVTLLRGVNLQNEKELIARLRETGIYYSVRPVEGEASQLFERLLASRERRDDAGIIYNKYFYKKDEIKKLLSDNGLDAVLLVAVNGITKRDKVYSSNYLSYLEADFNYLALTAQMLDAEGNTIWEYPNFRQRSLKYPMLLSLQYAAFDEAAANLSEKVDVKFKTLTGLKAALMKTRPSDFPNGGDVSVLYDEQYDEMISLLKLERPLFATSKGKKDPAR